jgi:hypothetical protein
MTPIPLIYAALAGAALASVGTWKVQEWRWASKEAEHLKADRLADEEARRIYAAMTDKYQGALNAARVRETTLRRDLAAAGSELDGLRDQLREADHRITTASATAVAEYATTTGELLVDCSRRYQELAGKADGHAADVRAIIEAWPVSKSHP